MRSVPVSILACLLIAPDTHAADGQAKKWLVGRWAPVVEKKADDAATTKPPAPKPKAPPRGKKAAKKPAEPKPPEELPKVLIEFTKDGRIRLDGDPSALGEKLRFVKPLAAFSMRVSPETKSIKINYEIGANDTLQVNADHGWLLEKLSGGGQIPPEKAKELDSEYRPRETLKVTATSQTLTLTNENGERLNFKRYVGDPLDVAEGKRTQQQLQQGLDPLREYMRQQGINVGGAEPSKEAKKKGAPKSK